MLRHNLYDVDRALRAALSVSRRSWPRPPRSEPSPAACPPRSRAAVVALVLQRLHPRAEKAPRPAIAVRTLGGFVVLRHGEPLETSAWQSRKARTLFKILIARRGRPVTREALMELLWPGEDPAKLSNRLSVALATLRSVLGPEVLVQAESGAVAVDLSVVDRRRRALPRGGPPRLSLYRGDFLEEDLYEDWAADLREEARAAYAGAVRTLAGGGDRRRGGAPVPASAGARPLGRRGAPGADRAARGRRPARRGAAAQARLRGRHGGDRRPTLRPLERLWGTVRRCSELSSSSITLGLVAAPSALASPLDWSDCGDGLQCATAHGPARLRQAVGQADLAGRDPPPGGRPEAPDRIAVRQQRRPRQLGRRLRAPRRRGDLLARGARALRRGRHGSTRRRR